MTAPIYQLPASFSDLWPKETVEFAGRGHIQPLAPAITKATEDRYLLEGRWRFGFDKHGRIHTVRAHPAS